MLCLCVFGSREYVVELAVDAASDEVPEVPFAIGYYAHPKEWASGSLALTWDGKCVIYDALTSEVNGGAGRAAFKMAMTGPLDFR